MLISFFYQVKQWLYLRLINPANIIALVMNKILFLTIEQTCKTSGQTM